MLVFQEVHRKISIHLFPINLASLSLSPFTSNFEAMEANGSEGLNSQSLPIPSQSLRRISLPHPISSPLNMQAVEAMEENHHSHPLLIPLHHQNPSDSISFCLSSLFPNSHIIHAPIHDFSPNTSCISNGTTPPFDETAGEDHQRSNNIAMTERRLKRMISNRESARRSRMRRKMQIDDLQAQVNHLQSTNRQLSEKLIQLLECNQQILQENVHLKEKVSSLQIIVSDLLSPLRNVGDIVTSSTSLIRAAEAPRPAATSSMHLLH